MGGRGFDGWECLRVLGGNENVYGEGPGSTTGIEGGVNGPGEDREDCGEYVSEGARAGGEW
jgi:hypothetical protein